MSDLTDEYVEQEAFYDDRQFEDVYDWAINPRWRMKDDKYIPVAEMKESHINNCIRCINDNRIKFDENESKDRWLKIFEAELKKREFSKEKQ